MPGPLLKQDAWGPPKAGFKDRLVFGMSNHDQVQYQAVIASPLRYCAIRLRARVVSRQVRAITARLIAESPFCGRLARLSAAGSPYD